MADQDIPQRRTLPPFPEVPVRCLKCKSEQFRSALLIFAEMPVAAIPPTFVAHRWPTDPDDPWNLVDWPAEWLGWTCSCGYQWETRCADETTEAPDG